MRKSLLGAAPSPPPPLEQPHEPRHAEAPSHPAAGPPIAASERRRAHGHGRERDDGDPPDAAPPRRRDHHGDRRTPPPPTFSLAELPDDTLLTQREVAAVGRWAVSTVETWRRRGHRLKWVRVGSGFIRYRAADLRQFLASDEPRKPKPSPAPAATATTEIPTKEDAASPLRRRRRAKADDPTTVQEQA